MIRYEKITAGQWRAVVGMAVCLSTGPASLWADEVVPVGGDGLDQALESAGWQVERESDGTLKLVPPHKPAAGGGVAQPRTKAASRRPDEAFIRQLEARGWKVSRDPDGSLNFYFPHRPGEPTPAAPPSPPAAQAPRSTGVPAALDRLLKQGGWRARRSGDGSLILVPAGAGRGTAAGQTTGDRIGSWICAGISPQPAVLDQMELPVDAWGEARRVAQDWLQSTGEQGLTVGKIRRILQVYVVSIVDDRSPFHLRHQIAIRNADARVIVLN